MPESADPQTFSTEWNPVDPDGDILTWSISGGADASSFTINAANGEITLNSVDFENPGDSDGNNTYDLQIRVTDGGGLFAVQNIHLDVTDVYEPPPLKIYEFIEDTGITWVDAKAAADAANDADSNYLIYLATITSENEYDQIEALGIVSSINS